MIAAMKRLLLISPVAERTIMGKDFFFRMPNLGLLKVAAVTSPGWDVKIIDEKVEALDLTQHADVVGITAMTPTVSRAYRIADQFRRLGTKVIMGGMHASSLPDEALGHCDAVVVGEAEGLWPKVLADFERGELQRVYRHENGWPSLGNQPLSNWRLYDSKNYLPVHFVETTRGCPLDCEFCSVTNAFGGKFRNRPQDDVVTELRNLRPFGGFLTLKNCVFFVDDNIISNRTYAREFLARIADLKLNWFSHASMNIVNDPEILKLCAQSGCRGLFIGFETLSPETMRSIGHKPNRPQDYFEIVRKIHDHGIGIDASFVFGFDTDDAGVFDRTIEFVIKAKIDIPYFSILTPYPGTRLHKRLRAEGRLITEDWSCYDTSHVVFRPTAMSAETLFAGYLRSWKESFSWSAMWQRLNGTKAWKNFFWPMNFGFHFSISKIKPAAELLHEYAACAAPELVDK